MAAELIHATAIAAGGRVAVIRGPSGSGKSDLALRCLGLPSGSLFSEPAVLLADDQVQLERAGEQIMARVPAAIAGKLEVRGLGILSIPAIATGPLPVSLVVDLANAGPIERLPDPWPMTRLLGVAIPALTLNGFEASAPLKLMLALSSPSLPLVG